MSCQVLLLGKLEYRREPVPAVDLAAVAAVEEGVDRAAAHGARDPRVLRSPVDLRANGVSRNGLEGAVLSQQGRACFLRAWMSAAGGLALEDGRRRLSSTPALGPERDLDARRRHGRLIRVSAFAAGRGGHDEKESGRSRYNAHGLNGFGLVETSTAFVSR